MPELAETLSPKLETLRPFAEKIATGNFERTHMFPAYLRSSFVRTFEFATLASKGSMDSAFFLLPALRGITEDIIYFAFLATKSHQARERFMSNMSTIEVHQRISNQRDFFQTFRPFQPVLTAEVPNIEEVKDELTAFWQANGWRRLKQGNPPTREIAQKTFPGILEQAYDFVYRFTSGAVHFNPWLLLKLGWGPPPAQDATTFDCKFSTKHMGDYYLATCRIYGCYLLCLYFELFDEFLEPKEAEKEAVAALREHIWQYFRWPEMITFEEMNRAVPKPDTEKWPNLLIYALYQVVMKEGFISGAKQILDGQNSQSLDPNLERSET